MLQKLVLKVDVHDQKTMTKIIKTTSNLAGVDSISVDRKENKMTVIADGIDPVVVVCRLRKFCHAEIITVGPAKEPEKKIEPKKEEQKQQEEGQMSKDEDQVKKDENAFAELNMSNQAIIDPYLALTVPEEDRNACVLM
ncbi:PREDICTED: uncharacterized protein LOC105135295 isoform X2 [Populus euphratica]|uniref:Uncharacterized protein LOC105135295 isoform X2 n=1 Tax=Populus euphratica TaxID=75702 RepID=A0AAJ6UZU1_POPEU|nr:PREDICTED: uncharacterized protein LOC105135295 isoform X2 [Populus euphratica]